MAILLLIFSVFAATLRSVFSKNMNTENGQTRQFFLFQIVSLFSSFVLVLLLSISSLCIPGAETIRLALLYGIALIAAQWMCTLAMKTGSVSICTMVYAFGFVIPTIGGALLWNTKINFLQIIGIGLVIVSIILTSIGNNTDTDSEKSGAKAVYYISLSLAFCGGGALGLLQQGQQHSKTPEQLGMFLIIAFAFATLASLIGFLVTKNKKNPSQQMQTDGALRKQYLSALIVGISFGLANIVNTYLAGVLEPVILFPILNVGSILATLTVSVLLLHERLRKQEKAALVLGILSILIISAGKML